MMTRDEAMDYIRLTRLESDIRDHPDAVEELVQILMAQEHAPWCRTHMKAIMPNYGSDCTCGAEEKS